MKTTITSPSRSQGPATPRRYSTRRTRSVGSPALSNVSGRLSTLTKQLKENEMDSFLVSPMNRRSVLSDNTDIEMPQSKSWWKKLDETSGEIMAVLHSENIDQGDKNILEDYIQSEGEVLSQEKKNYTLELPESSGSDTIDSIVLPQRKLFTHNENLPKQRFGKVIGAREALTQHQKSKNIEKSIHVSPKKIFGEKKRQKSMFPPNIDIVGKENSIEDIETKSKKIFGVELIQNTKKSTVAIKPIENLECPENIEEATVSNTNMCTNQEDQQQSKPPIAVTVSVNKTVTNVSKEMAAAEAQVQKRNLFGNRGGTKRKNIFADFKLYDSEEDILEIETSVWKGLQRQQVPKRRKSSASRGLRDVSLTSSAIATDTEIDEWNMLPSSTMIADKLDEKIDQTDSEQKNENEKSEEIESDNQDNDNYEDENIDAEDNDEDMDQTDAEQKNENEKSVEAEIESDNQGNDNDEVENVIAEDNDEARVQEDSEQMIENEKLINYEQEVENVAAEDNGEAIVQEDSKQNNENKKSDELEIESDKQDNDNDEQEVENVIAEDNDEQIDHADNEQNNENEKSDELEIESDNEMLNDNDEQEIENVIAEDNDEEIEDTDSEQNNENEKSNELEIESDNDMLNYSDEPEVENVIAEDNDEEIEHTDSEQNNENEKSDELKIESDNQDNDNDEQEVENVIAEDNEEKIDKTNENEKSDQAEIESDNQDNDNDEVKNVIVEDNEEARVQEDSEQIIEKEKSNEAAMESDNQDNDNHDQEDENIDAEDNDEEMHQTDSVQKNENEKSDEAEIESDDEDNEKYEKEFENIEAEDNDEEMVQKYTEQSNENEKSNLPEIENDDQDNENYEQEVEHVAVEYNDEEIDRTNSEENNDDEKSDEAEIESDNEDVDNYEQEIDQENGPEEIAESPNITHDTTGRNRKKINETKVKTPEVVRQILNNPNDSITNQGRNTSIRKTKSMIMPVELKPRMTNVRDSVGTDGSDFSAQGSGWDSHRTTRKTLRQTFGKDFTPRKSLRALVMEKAAKRQTVANESQPRFSLDNPQANSTEIGSAEPSEMSERNMDDQYSEASYRHDESKENRLDELREKLKQVNLMRKQQMENKIQASLKTKSNSINDLFKVPLKPSYGARKGLKSFKVPAQPQSKSKPKPRSAVPLGELPAELIAELKYKPPQRFAPSNASWTTNRLYKYLESKLEPQYDYMARVRAERLMETLYNFTKLVRRMEPVPRDVIRDMKHELARLRVVRTHHDFYEFFHEFMPREIRVKVVPDACNKYPLPRRGIFADIIKDNELV